MSVEAHLDSDDRSLGDGCVMDAAPRLSGLVTVAFVGAFVAAICDANHVRSLTLTYRDPALFGQAWWVFPNFLLSFFVLAALYAVLARRLSPLVETTRSRSAGTLPAFLAALAAFAIVYLASGFGSDAPALLSIVFYVSFAIRGAATYERAWLVLLALLMAAGGMLAEGMIGAAGLAAYRHADIFHVPLWLGGVYMHGAFALRESMRYFACSPPRALTPR